MKDILTSQASRFIGSARKFCLPMICGSIYITVTLRTASPPAKWTVSFCGFAISPARCMRRTRRYINCCATALSSTVRTGHRRIYILSSSTMTTPKKISSRRSTSLRSRAWAFSSVFPTGLCLSTAFPWWFWNSKALSKKTQRLWTLTRSSPSATAEIFRNCSNTTPLWSSAMGRTTNTVLFSVPTTISMRGERLSLRTKSWTASTLLLP